MKKGIIADWNKSQWGPNKHLPFSHGERSISLCRQQDDLPKAEPCEGRRKMINSPNCLLCSNKTLFSKHLHSLCNCDTLVKIKIYSETPC